MADPCPECGGKGWRFLNHTDNGGRPVNGITKCGTCDGIPTTRPTGPDHFGRVPVTGQGRDGYEAVAYSRPSCPTCGYPLDSPLWSTDWGGGPCQDPAHVAAHTSAGTDDPATAAVYEIAARAAALSAQVRDLERWKAEAIELLTAWERVWEALGEPGALGSSKAAAALDHVQALLAAGDALGDALDGDSFAEGANAAARWKELRRA